jgi:hypothetical protein
MWHLLAFDRVPANVLALQANAERAGAALACAYASSDEFEAAVIRSKRAAGVYGPRWLWRSAFCVGAAAVALAMLAIAI